MCSLYLWVSLLHICIPLMMVRVFFNNNARKQFKKVKICYWMTSDDWPSTLGITNHISGTFLAHWTTRWPDDWSHDFRLFRKQLNAPSIGMRVYSFQIQFSSYWIRSLFHQFIFFISALTLSPLFGAKLCHILGCLCDWV